MEQKIRDIIKTLGLLLGAIWFAYYGFSHGSLNLYFFGGIAVALFLALLIAEIVLLKRALI